MSALAALLLLAAGPDTAAAADVAVLAHAVMRGDRIEAGDFSYEAREPAAARGALDAGDAAGMEAARNLMAGSVVRSSDLVTPRLVKRGEPVTLRIVSGPLTITAAGRALGSAGAGEAVRVVADSTSRTLDGIVDGEGSVRIRTP